MSTCGQLELTFLDYVLTDWVRDKPREPVFWAMCQGFGAERTRSMGRELTHLIGSAARYLSEAPRRVDAHTHPSQATPARPRQLPHTAHPSSHPTVFLCLTQFSPSTTHMDRRSGAL